MNLWDILILLAVGAMVLLAVRAIRKGRAGGCHGGAGCRCGGGCGDCPRDCAGCAKKDPPASDGHGRAEP